jgi:hypothetical protein
MKFKINNKIEEQLTIRKIEKWLINFRVGLLFPDLMKIVKK